MEDVLKELKDYIDQFEGLKRKYPKMNTQDVIDFLNRFHSKLEDSLFDHDCNVREEYERENT